MYIVIKMNKTNIKKQIFGKTGNGKIIIDVMENYL